jgi:nicotinamidase-related amidase
MPIRSKDLHGNLPDSAATALLMIDVINDFEFENGEQLLRLALPVGKRIAELKRKAKAIGIPAIYARLGPQPKRYDPRNHTNYTK